MHRHALDTKSRANLSKFGGSPSQVKVSRDGQARGECEEVLPLFSVSDLAFPSTLLSPLLAP